MLRITPYSLGEFDLWSTFRDFEKEFASAKVSDLSIRTDIKDMGDAYLLEAELPGFSKEDIKIDIENDLLKIKAERKMETSESDKDEKYVRRERRYGIYERSFNIEDIEADMISAEYKDGILKVTMPKKQEVLPKTRSLEIN